MSIALTPTQAAIVAQLHPALRLRLEHILAGLEGRLVPFAGHRKPEEQARLYEKGRTVVWGEGWSIVDQAIVDKKKVVTYAPPFKSAHNFSPARACDCVLNPAAFPAGLAVVEHAGRKYPNLWDTKTPEAKAAWEDYGIHAREVGLVWGGDWKMKDLPHVELPNFASDEWNT